MSVLIVSCFYRGAVQLSSSVSSDESEIGANVSNDDDAVDGEQVI